jgi:hypothetical protein
MVIGMWKSATLALVVLAALGCATPEQRQTTTPEPRESTAEPRQSTPEPRQSTTPEPRQSATPEQRKKRIAADQERIAAQMQRDLAPVCTSAGLTPGTDAHSRCVMSLYRQELKRRAATAASPSPERL